MNEQDGRPFVFADVELSRRLERAEGHTNREFVEARARLFPEVGACWKEVAGTYAMFDGAASMLTQTFGLGLFQEATAEVLDEDGAVLDVAAFDGGGAMTRTPDRAAQVRVLDDGGRTLDVLPIAPAPEAPFGDYGDG